LLSLACVGCARGEAIAFEPAQRTLTVQRSALYPETIEFDRQHDQFLVGSFREGAIYRVDDKGDVSRLVDDLRLCSVLGIALDLERGRVWAVNSDLGASAKPSALGPKKLAAVGVYDLTTGAAQQYIDLTALFSGPHLLNGIALDTAGNAYVTDSFSPVIYKIATDGHASVFLQDAQFSGEGISLNGLVVHPDGYLLVIKKSDGSLFKVPIDEPAHFSKVAIAQTFIGGDGVTLIGKRSLLVIANQTPDHTSNTAFSLSSDDGWVSAKVQASQQLGDSYSTTAALRDDKIYVIQSKLNELIAAPLHKKDGLRVQATIRQIAKVDR
jgi:hypothetical protein